jgi:NAD(P)-dependent dehydrogenase (short-subunit alcohol dehydrogenase family)
MNKRIPLGRLGKPEDLAGPVVFLLSDMAGYGELSGLGNSIGVMQKADRFRAEQ